MNIPKDRKQSEEGGIFFQNDLLRIADLKVVGSNGGLKTAMDLVRRVAPLNSPVLLLGETGVGKELIAKTIHHLSSRKNKPFIDVNCGAIPASLIDSDLFGHEKGAFSGALSTKQGKFERAQGGTIFLDEIGELPLDAQVRFLRVLQEKRIERVGGVNPIELEIRVIAATHRNLTEMMETGGFRQDLFFRLRVFPITIPPLRDRKPDIPELARFFVRKKAGQMHLDCVPSFSADAMETLIHYPWPGNVRELENTIERALILNRKKPISVKELGLHGPNGDAECRHKNDYADPSSDLPRKKNGFSLNDAMAEHIQKVLAITKGKINGKGGAAELLEINPRTLRHRMEKLNIPFGRKAGDLYGCDDEF